MSTAPDEELRATVREYVLLDAERATIVAGAPREHLRGAARSAWLKRARSRLEALRWRLVALAVVEGLR